MLLCHLPALLLHATLLFHSFARYLHLALLCRSFACSLRLALLLRTIVSNFVCLLPLLFLLVVFPKAIKFFLCLGRKVNGAELVVCTVNARRGARDQRHRLGRRHVSSDALGGFDDEPEAGVVGVTTTLGLELAHLGRNGLHFDKPAACRTHDELVVTVPCRLSRVIFGSQSILGPRWLELGCGEEKLYQTRHRLQAVDLEHAAPVVPDQVEPAFLQARFLENSLFPFQLPLVHGDDAVTTELGCNAVAAGKHESSRATIHLAVEGQDPREIPLAGWLNVVGRSPRVRLHQLGSPRYRGLEGGVRDLELGKPDIAQPIGVDCVVLGLVLCHGGGGLEKVDLNLSGGQLLVLGTKLGLLGVDHFLVQAHARVQGRLVDGVALRGFVDPVTGVGRDGCVKRQQLARHRLCPTVRVQHARVHSVRRLELKLVVNDTRVDVC